MTDHPDHPPSDTALLTAYARDRDPAAFATLVHRHADLVYNACLRQTRGHHHLADDATQATFLLLAQRAHRLKPTVILAGWLYTTARHTAANACRAESRRRRHEQKAATAMPTATPPADASDASLWNDLAPLLDPAVNALPARDRDAILLRYFQAKPIRDVAAALNISEDAAKQRCSRAVEKLRRHFTARGLTTPAAALTPLLAATSANATPPTLISTACGFALPTAVTSASVATLAKSTLFLAQMKTLATTMAAAATVLIATGTTVLLLHRPALPNPPAPTPAIPIAAPAPPADPAPDPQARLTAAYALKDDQFVRLIRPPFPPERVDLVIKRQYSGKVPAEQLDQFGTAAFQWTPTGQLRTSSFSLANYGTVYSALRDCLDLARYQLEIPADLRSQHIIGDWVVRRPSSFDDRLRDLEPYLLQLPKPIHLRRRQEDREVIVVTGVYQLRPLPGLPNDRKIHLGTGDLAHPKPPVLLGRGGGSGDFSGFLRRVADTINQHVIDETLDGARRVTWVNEDLDGADDHDDARDSLLDNLAQQTSLRFTRQRRTVDIWFHADDL